MLLLKLTFWRFCDIIEGLVICLTKVHRTVMKGVSKMADFKVTRRSRVEISITGKDKVGVIDAAYEQACFELGENYETCMHTVYDKKYDETQVFLYPCKLVFETAYAAIDSPKQLRLLSGNKKRRFVGTCNIYFNKDLLPLSDEAVVEALWLPIKKSDCRKFLTLIPYTDDKTGNKRWHIICDSRLSNKQSARLMMVAATKMMGKIATNVSSDSLDRLPPIVGYIDRLSTRMTEILQKYSNSSEEAPS